MVLELNAHLERKLLNKEAQVPQTTPTNSPGYYRPPPDVEKWTKPLITTYGIETKGSYLYLSLADALYGRKIE